MKTKRIYLIVCAFASSALFTVDAVANEPPSPQQIFTTVKNHWLKQEIAQLDTYIDNLYNGHSKYVPAILAASFRDHIYLGKLSAASSKLFTVLQLVNSDEDMFENNFKDLLSEQYSALVSEINMHARHETTPAMLESNADANTVRNTWGTTLLPGINLLFYAPATNTVR